MSDSVERKVLYVSIPHCCCKGLSWVTGKYTIRIDIIFHHPNYSQSDTLQIEYPVLVIIGCQDIFPAENIGKSKQVKGIYSRG